MMKRLTVTVIAGISSICLCACTKTKQEETSIPKENEIVTVTPVETETADPIEELAHARIDIDIATAQDIINSTRTSYSTERFAYEKTTDAYSQCSDAVKALYDEMKIKIEQLEHFSYAIADGYTYEDLDHVFMAWAAITEDNPYYDTYFQIREVLDESGEMTVALESHYFMPYDTMAEVNADVEEIKTELEVFDAMCRLVVEGIDETWSTYDKYRYLAVVISLRTSYDYNADGGIEIGSGYAGIGGGLSICEGYSKAMLFLCREADLYCQIVSGDTGGTSHAWNLVKLSTGTYYVDVTWSDEQEETGGELWGEYFMFTEEKALESRVIWDDVTATGTEL